MKSKNSKYVVVWGYSFFGGNGMNVGIRIYGIRELTGLKGVYLKLPQKGKRQS